jgi:hypothetical protein
MEDSSTWHQLVLQFFSENDDSELDNLCQKLYHDEQSRCESDIIASGPSGVFVRRIKHYVYTVLSVPTVDDDDEDVYPHLMMTMRICTHS